MATPAAPSASSGPAAASPAASGAGSTASSAPNSAASLFGVSSPEPSAPILDDGGEGAAPVRDAEGLEALDGAEDQLSDAEAEAQRANAEDEGAQQQEQATEEGAEEQQGEGYTFAGQEFRDQAHAEAEFKRAHGRLKAQGAQMSELRQHALAAIQSAQAWQQHVQTLQQAGPGGLSGGKAADGGPAGETAPPAGPGLTSLADSLDWGQVDKLSTEQGTGAALNFSLRKLVGALDQAISARIEPLTQFHQSIEHVRATTQLFEQAAQATDSQGAPLYPELDPEGAQAGEAAPKVVAIWKRITQDFPALKDSPQAVHFAVLEYRRLYGAQAPAAGKTSTTNPSRPAPRGNGVGAQVSRALRQASEANVAVAQGANGAPLRPKRGPVTEADSLRKDLERARGRVNPVFGVAR
jgi:hypothetical protein